jgi:hypothetical protein
MNDIPNWLNPAAINAVLNAEAAFETPGARGVVKFPSGVRPFGMLAGHTVLVESTPEGDWWRAPTSAERQAEWRAKHDAEQARERAAIAAHDELVRSATGLRKNVLQLHAPEDGGCAGCDACCCASVWPCRTYALARDWQE